MIFSVGTRAAHRLIAVSREEQENGKKTKSGIRNGSECKHSEPFLVYIFGIGTAFRSLILYSSYEPENTHMQHLIELSYNANSSSIEKKETCRLYGIAV